jgi:hypothetical protein
VRRCGTGCWEKRRESARESPADQRTIVADYVTGLVSTPAQPADGLNKGSLEAWGLFCSRAKVGRMRTTRSIFIFSSSLLLFLFFIFFYMVFYLYFCILIFFINLFFSLL